MGRQGRTAQLYITAEEIAVGKEVTMKKIGNVTLDTSCYPGEDLYSDGKVEERILELAKTYPQESYNQIIISSFPPGLI